jgi:transposase-like protein
MERDDAEEYTQALGQIVVGSWRQIALAQRLGVPDALGMSLETWVNERLGGYIKMSIPDRREAVKELTANGHSTREVADILGVNQSTVVRDDANASTEPIKPSQTNSVADADDANASPDPIAEAQRERELQTIIRCESGRQAAARILRIDGDVGTIHEAVVLGEPHLVTDRLIGVVAEALKRLRKLRQGD